MSQIRELSRRDFLGVSGRAAATVMVGPRLLESVFRLDATPEPPVTSADEALQRLMEGNQRFVNGTTIGPNRTDSRRGELVAGQNPFAIVFGCVDSRVPPELVFDRGLGDLFIVRTAAQVIDNAVLGSLEYGVEELHIPLLMVLGHQKCGAVVATIDAVEKNAQAPGQINDLVRAIRPAVEQVKGQTGDLVENAIRANVVQVVSQLKVSPIMTEAIAAGHLKVVGARYELGTGLVEITAP